MGFINTLKRVKIRKREKTYTINQKKDKNIKIEKIENNLIFKEVSESELRSNASKSLGNTSVEQKIDVSEIEETDEHKKVEKKSSGSVLFEHELTEFEFKLRYLNLNDLTGKEFGRFFPPIKRKLVIFDEGGRKFSVARVGSNQISGDILSYFKSNQLKPGDIISIEYDYEEKSKDGTNIIHLKTKKNK